jgi:hypothetical protein
VQDGRSCREARAASAVPRVANFYFATTSSGTRTLLERTCCRGRDVLAALDELDSASGSSRRCASSRRLELKPAKRFQPIRMAVTGSKVSPGLFESLELLGREESLSRLRRAVAQRPRRAERVERALELKPGSLAEGGARHRRPLAFLHRALRARSPHLRSGFCSF